ncbi:uncharacterized protein BP5553_08639 [Venustampulla echinocandica]|uniref:Uncharacterized protein n=1 Tax=Venustampulla echinocandica TaxID=2656787 RepID=A0A370TEX9_9HELO|nr:uncharacterized protein BP5553_08639 [Venustampulla echinocandica]RDL33200.1 hypothetical protein BP5553_08639 [Venustampulla echinocandica]
MATGVPILDTTLQAALMSAASNVVAQSLAIYQHKDFSAIDSAAFVYFTVFALLSTPPNFLWQEWLENSFPAIKKKNVGNLDKGLVPSQKGDRLSVSNTAIKFLLDQSLGAGVNTMLFIVVMGMFKGLEWAQILDTLQRDFWQMILASYKVWPFVCLLNLVVVPFEYRMLVGNTVGFGWSVYLSLFQL